MKLDRKDKMWSCHLVGAHRFRVTRRSLKKGAIYNNKRKGTEDRGKVGTTKK